ncbi:exodeoxyribonuclease V subunit gamma [Pseudogulbenkiania ferrooxidans]|uniref:RecBCD enzyme subunit RecC n=1 Tax=Pseudogulbenkiania ferrooxidans 2002 TaxID=279714 RepID=B9YZ34_9NEIS|nr:exodeoxyribonuclease V subunit gamma [Pseudogulbenkiania ferrooxidans]EEG10387.1 exodeoxyribonuclease V, gamma subunit [Pseudogulbenkiania ferrooxidans 2002]
MLHLYQSNRLEALGELFTGMSRAMPLSDPFQPETVLVQSRGMGRWLTLELAGRAGIAANLDFVLPAAFAWRLMQAVLPGLPRKSSFAPEVLQWRLLELLPTLHGAPFTPLVRYLEGGEAAGFELAGKIADIFDQYLVFRPDWIRAWERGELLDLGEDEAWQAALWQRLAEADPGRHRVRLLDDFLGGLRPEHLPERVSLFGIASLAPMYLAMIKRLAALTDVCVFLLNPCEAYWGDIVDARGQLKLFQQGMAAHDDHPLLASLGKQGRDFFDQIAEEMPEGHPLFLEPHGDTLLARLQRDILTLTPPGAAPAPPAPGDRSIELNAVHSPMRELEVLKDRLLARFAADPTLTPADVAVLTPDINAYAPYIDAVFGQRDDAPNIPYTIADRRIEREEPLLATFAAVLQLADSRFGADAVLALLDCDALLARFGLADAEVPLLQQWVRESGIRWGRDAAHKAALGLPADPLYTWRWGLDRLLLGTVLPPALAGDASPLFGGLLPAAGAEGQLAETLARFGQLFDVLDGCARAWAEPASPAVWRTRLQGAVEALFAVDEAGEAALTLLFDALAELAEDAQLAAFDAPVGLAVVRDWLTRRLTLSAPSGFLAGGVTFCAMVPMRSIPFRVLCLIGMNDGAYPRDERPVSFDLVARHPRRGDRSRRFDDRYLFLEALLSAREALYLSWVGRSVRTDEPLPPSPLVAELLDTLAKMAGCAVEVVQHPLQPFARAAFDGSDPRRHSFEPSYAAALAAPRHEPAPFAVALPGGDATVLRLDELLRFWRHPARAWLADRLGVKLAGSAEDVPVREPFTVERDTRETLRRELVGALLASRPLAPVKDKLVGAGLLPPAALGQAWLAEETTASVRFARRLPPELAQPLRAPESIELTLDGVTLVGELSGLRDAGLLRVVARKAYAGELIELWLSHLVLCAARPAGVAPYSALYDEEGVHELCDEPDAAELLRPWLARWQQGQSQPLPFFARTSWAYARSLAEKPDQPEAALAKALAEWDPAYDGKTPQKDEAAIRLAFRHLDPLADPLFAQLADTLLLPLAERLLGVAEGDQA